MQAGQKVWRDGIATLLSTAALTALAEALCSNDPHLIQGATTNPPPLPVVEHWPCEGACPVGYAGWIGEGLETIGEVETFFARMVHEVDKRLGAPGACRPFFSFWD